MGQRRAQSPHSPYVCIFTTHITPLDPTISSTAPQLTTILSFPNRAALRAPLCASAGGNKSPCPTAPSPQHHHTHALPTSQFAPLPAPRTHALRPRASRLAPRVPASLPSETSGLQSRQSDKGHTKDMRALPCPMQKNTQRRCPKHLKNERLRQDEERAPSTSVLTRKSVYATYRLSPIVRVNFHKFHIAKYRLCRTISLTRNIEVHNFGTPVKLKEQDRTLR